MAADAIPRDNGFHPDLRKTARFVPRSAVTSRSLPVIRALEPLAFRGRKDVEALTLASGGHVRLHRPPGSDERLREEQTADVGPAPAMLWIHGGGYVAGRTQQDDQACGQFSRALGITVAAPSYRRAPEHPYPAALQDLYAALKWLVSLPAVDSRRVAIGVKARAAAWLPRWRSWSATEARSPRSTAFELSDARRPDRVKPGRRAQLSAVERTQ